MKNKGFTLIELLAVIVILAIIALIATPIILGIISDTRSQAKKRSAELVYKGVEYAYTQTLLTNTTGSEFTLTDINNKLRIENVTSTTVNGTTLEIVTKDGVYCGVTKNTTTKSIDVVCGTDSTDYTSNDIMETKSIVYGTSQPELNFKPQYYSMQTDGLYIGDDLPEDITTNPSTFDHNVYLGYDGDASGKITEEYVCFVTDKEYCMKYGEGTYDEETYEFIPPSPYYDINKEILKIVFEEEECYESYNEFSCVVYSNRTGSVYFTGGLYYSVSSREVSPGEVSLGVTYSSCSVGYDDEISSYSICNYDM